MTENDDPTISPEEADDLAAVEEYSDAPAEELAPRRRRPWWQKALTGVGWTVVALVVLGILVFEFGGMANSANDPAMRQQYRALVQAGKVAPVSHRFVIPIPGCTCHSTDPVQTEVHRYYRMSECSRCHG